jgi:hypothetical protein
MAHKLPNLKWNLWNFVLLSLRNLKNFSNITLSVAQHRKFKTRQETLEPRQIIMWGDFRENYASFTQNAIQSDYFNNKQITLHPFTIYYKKDGEVKPLSYCVISDCRIHDTNT